MKTYFGKRNHRLVFAALLLAMFIPGPGQAGETKAKNVIFLMVDGCGVNHTTAARWYKGSPLAMDEAACGLVKTHGSDSIITDSAPAATAFGTGRKTSDKFLGVLPKKTSVPGVRDVPDEMRYKPVASILEAARLSGRSTGLIATSNIQHASPAGLSAHWPDRGNYEEIALQQVYGNIDVVFGGGRQYLLPPKGQGVRKDGKDLLEVLKRKGYEIVATRDEMAACRSGKVWGLFAAADMAYEMDRALTARTEPSLAEMTAKAIEILSRNEKGFFLFVEGSKVDWASHANDPVGVISDVLAFDDAVKVALDFAKKDGGTLVLVFSDHDNGGMSIGNKTTDKTYSSMPAENLTAPLKRARLTGEGIEKVLGDDRSEPGIRKAVEQYYGIKDLSAAEVSRIQKSPPGSMNCALGPIMSSRSIIGWTTTGHNGADVPLYAFGPGKPAGTIDNTDLAFIAAGAMGLDLDAADGRLFVNVQDLVRGREIKTRLDRSDVHDSKLVLEKGPRRAYLPLSRNIIEIGQSGRELSGLVILAPVTGKVYVPADALDILKASGF